MKIKETSIVKKSASISFLVIVGKILGFIKQAVIAWAFGSNALTDVYFAADGYSSMFGQIMSQTVGPTVLTQYINLYEKEKYEESKKLVRDSYLFFSLLSFAIISINFFFADKICNVIGISYTEEQLAELKFFLVAMLPVMLFTSIIGVSSGYLDAHNRFLPGRLTSLFFSISIIGFVLAFRGRFGLRSLLYGFLLGYVLHMFLMLFLVVPKVGIGFSNPYKNADFVEMVKRFIPLVIGISVVDLGHLVDRIIASSLESGSVSTLHYGQVISSDIVSSVIVTSVGVVLLTSISKDVASNTDFCEIKKRIQNIMSTMTFVIAGITALYFVEGKDLIKLFFERGSFDSSSTSMVSSVAVCYSVGFIFTANRDILVKTHYAYHDTKSPMINSMFGVGLNIVMSFALSKLMGVAGIALATSISMIFVFFLSSITLKKHIHGSVFEHSFVINMIKSVACFAITVIVGKLLFLLMFNINYLIRMFIIGICMCFVYLCVGFLFKECTVIGIFEQIRRRIMNKSNKRKHNNSGN